MSSSKGDRVLAAWDVQQDKETVIKEIVKKAFDNIFTIHIICRQKILKALYPMHLAK